MKPEIVIRGNKYGDSAEVQVLEREHLDPRARFAMAMIEKWGIPLLADDGEDSTGRQKFKQATVAEVVDRACQMSDVAFNTFAASGWVTKLPSVDELEAAQKAATEAVK